MLEQDIQARVDAYRGNPDGLMQKYQQNQQLIDLLALQKIKSEKEAAARQMQLQSAQQQAAQGEPPTVAQQREQEVMSLTKNELAGQQGALLQQQAGEKQALMQKLFGGLASAPGAQQAAQPQAMAAGGIVAFAEGGETDEELTEEERREREQRKRDRAAMAGTLRKMGAAAMDVGTLPGRAVAGAAETAITRPLRALGLDIPYLPESFYGGDRGSATPYMDKLRREEKAGAQPEGQRGFQADVRRVDNAMPEAPPPPQKTAPMPMVGGAGSAGIASLAQRPAPAGPAAPADPFADKLKKSLEGMIDIDPQKAKLAEEQRVEGKLSFPEEQKRRQEYAEKRRRMMESEFDPERLREERLRSFLLGARGQGSIGRTLGAAGISSAAQENQQRAAERERLKELEDYDQGIFGLRKAAVEGGIGAGAKAYEQQSADKRTGITGGYHVMSTEAQSREKALDREVERLKIGVQATANKIAKEGLSVEKARATLGMYQMKIEELERKLDGDFAKENGMLIQLERMGKGLDPAQKNQLEIARTQLEQRKAQIRKEMAPVLDSAKRTLGITGVESDGWGKPQRVS